MMIMNDARLFDAFRPTHYQLTVTMQRKARRFHGEVIITGQLRQAAGSITLHAHKLHILSAAIDELPARVELGQQDKLIVQTAALAAGEHRVTIHFEGTITNTMHGLYPCSATLNGQKEELLATQFESHHAREVFPCIDEPEAKAMFDITLLSEPGVTVVGNTPVKAQREETGWLITTFETTPIMSTYLVAWVVGKLAFRETRTQSGTLVRAYATPDKQDQLDFALDVAVKTIEFYNDYFAIAYPLPKCDLIALPDFSSGAMENWGCITFREAVLLVGEHTATHVKQYVAMVIAHELAHQWFGNLVTMKWWNDLWLNESFANWMEYFATDHLFPEWDMWTQYYASETMQAINRDALAGVQKIQQEVHTPAEIQTLFDPAIVYAKGGSLLNMLQAYLGAEAFRDGLRLYLHRHQYGNAKTHDLWLALGEASGSAVVDFMEPWITQAGLPMVTVGEGNNTLALHQRRFYSNPTQAAHNDQTVWPIPLLAQGKLTETLFDQPAASCHAAQTEQPLLLNQGRSGYYLTLYDTAHTATLADQVRGGHLSTIDRLGLLNDSLNLSKSGLCSQIDALQLLEAYRHESSQPVWDAIADHFNVLKMFADDNESQLQALRSFIARFVRQQYQRLGWESKPHEAYTDTLLRPQIISHLAYAEDETAVAQLQAHFAAAAQPTDIWADIRATTCATAAKFAGRSAFDTLLTWYKTTTSAEVRLQVMAGLTNAREPSLTAQVLELLTTDEVKLQDLFYWIIYLTRNRFARQLTWQWTQDNWQWIVGHYGGDMHYTDFPKYIADTFSTREQLAAYRAFFEPKLDDPGLQRSIRLGIEDIGARVLWRERDAGAVAAYVQSQMSSSQAVTS